MPAGDKSPTEEVNMPTQITIQILFFAFLLSACIPLGAIETSVATPTGQVPANPSQEPQPGDEKTPPATEISETPTGELPELILVYTLEGGIAGFCDRLEVYASGRMASGSCTGAREAEGQLEAQQLALLLGWAGRYQDFEYIQADDEAVADKMTVAVQFSGAGEEAASAETQRVIFNLAGELWAQVVSGRPAGTPAAGNPTLTPQDGGEPEEILILSPGPGSRLTSPLTVSGMADSTFEQTLVVRLLSIDGEELALVPTTIQAELGQGGPFEAELSFEVSGELPGFIQVYASSPRDGGFTHLSSVGVTLAESGPVDLRPAGMQVERISIHSPVLAVEISGGVVHVEGTALPSFEGTLIVEVLDEDGDVIGSLPIIVSAPDIGQFGPFSADVPYTLARAGAGRVVVRDPSPAFPGDVHLASVEVRLEP
jgi:hypothetical protein